ncbi:hypothetical protein ACKKBF_B32490 [Auxenochlorella protothecoides x Auxenochlorella symbiontica]
MQASQCHSDGARKAARSIMFKEKGSNWQTVLPSIPRLQCRARELEACGAQSLISHEFLGNAEPWILLVLPPALGGVAVGLLGVAVGGYDDPPTPGSKEALPGPQGEPEEQAASVQAGVFQAMGRTLARSAGAILTLGSGASLGPEGPSVDIGQAWAKGVRLLVPGAGAGGLHALLAAGAGAGVAAGFNAPLSGVLFALESVLQPGQGEQKARPAPSLTLAMVLLAAALAAAVSQAGLGSSPAFRVPAYRLESYAELPLFLALGTLCGLVATSFTYSVGVAEDAFKDLTPGAQGEGDPSGDADGGRQSIGACAWRVLMPAVGGLTTGVLSLGHPEILYHGFDNVNAILSVSSRLSAWDLSELVVLKIIATSMSRGSGLQGGLYAPSIFIGAALGSAYGLALQGTLGTLGVPLSAPEAYALVGVAAVLASACSVPLTAALLVFELTRDYLILLPTLGAVGLSFWVGARTEPGVRRAGRARTERRRRERGASGPGAGDPVAALSVVAAAAAGDAAMLAALRRQAQAVQAAEGAAEAGPPALATLDLEALTAASGSEEHGPPGAVPDVATAAALSSQALTVACAADGGCLLLAAGTPVPEAVAAMRRGGHTVSVVVGPGGEVVGVVSLVTLERLLLAEAATAGGEEAQ